MAFNPGMDTKTKQIWYWILLWRP